MKKISLLVFVLLLGATSLFTACLPEEDSLASFQQAQIDEQKILDYIELNNLDATKADAGFYYVVDSIGSAEKPDITSTVSMRYRGRFLNNEIFDTSFDQETPVEFPLANLIQGWQLGIPIFGKGGKGTLLLPSDLAYGEAGQLTGGVPAHAVLIFDIELVNFY
ncbi:MAG: FKBP-type peptidyl-prolyl cis-trans isomerase [Chitinophagales bacterium]